MNSPVPPYPILEDIFYEFDKDCSGKLSYKEFKKLTHCLFDLKKHDSSSADSFEKFFKILF